MRERNDKKRDDELKALVRNNDWMGVIQLGCEELLDENLRYVECVWEHFDNHVDEVNQTDIFAEVCSSCMRAQQNEEPLDGFQWFILGVMNFYGLHSVIWDDEKAREYFRKGAEADNSLAMNSYAYMLYHGQGGPKNLELAKDYFRQAANRGLALAMNNDASMLEDKDDAIRCFHKAIDSGCQVAMVNLAQEFSFGDSQDHEKARAYLLAAIEFGLPRAMCDYAYLLMHGMGGPVDRPLAVYWMDKGAALEKFDMHVEAALKVDYLAKLENAEVSTLLDLLWADAAMGRRELHFGTKEWFYGKQPQTLLRDWIKVHKKDIQLLQAVTSTDHPFSQFLNDKSRKKADRAAVSGGGVFSGSYRQAVDDEKKIDLEQQEQRPKRSRGKTSCCSVL